MFKRSKFILLAGGILLLSACNAKTSSVTTETTPTQTIAVTEAETVSFQITDETRYIVEWNGTETDVTDNVSNFVDSKLYVTQDAIRKIFSMSDIVISDSLIADFNKRIESSGLKVSSGNYYRLDNPEHTLLLKENSTVYVFDNRTMFFSDPVLLTEGGKLSIPLMDILFNMGVKSVGSSVDNEGNVHITADYMPSDAMFSDEVSEEAVLASEEAEESSEEQEAEDAAQGDTASETEESAEEG